MKLIAIISLLFSLNTFASTTEVKESTYNKIIAAYSFSTKFNAKNYTKTAVSGRCFRENSSIPFGSVLLIDTMVVDSGPLGESMASLGTRLTSWIANDYDSKSYFDLADQITNDNTYEYLENGNGTTLGDIELRQDFYSQAIYAISGSLACYYYQFN